MGFSLIILLSGARSNSLYHGSSHLISCPAILFPSHCVPDPKVRHYRPADDRVTSSDWIWRGKKKKYRRGFALSSPFPPDEAETKIRERGGHAVVSSVCLLLQLSRFLAKYFLQTCCVPREPSEKQNRRVICEIPTNYVGNSFFGSL